MKEKTTNTKIKQNRIVLVEEGERKGRERERNQKYESMLFCLCVCVFVEYLQHTHNTTNDS